MRKRVERYCRAVLQDKLDEYYEKREKKCYHFPDIKEEKRKELKHNMKAIVIKLKNVFVYSMEEQLPVSLFYDGNIYRLDKAGVCETKKTVELNNLIKEKHKEESEKKFGKEKGNIVARSSSGVLIYENPLNDIIKLKEEGKLAPLRVASVLREYHVGLKSSTISMYASAYRSHINKGKNNNSQSNKRPETYETVTEKDRQTVAKTVLELGEGHFDTILKHLDMTEYKLRLILSDDKVYEVEGTNGKEKYKLKDPSVITEKK